MVLDPRGRLFHSMEAKRGPVLFRFRGCNTTIEAFPPSLVFLLIGLECRICDWLVSVEPFYRMVLQILANHAQEEAVPPMTRLGANQMVES